MTRPNRGFIGVTRRGVLAGGAAAAAIPTAALSRIQDVRQIPDHSMLEGDLCIIGGGPAGISIARRLAGTGARILLFESGGKDFERETQDLYIGENVGLPYFDLDVTRLRFLGGSSNHWGNQVSDFEPIDFEDRPWIPHSGWPIDRADLDEYYKASFDFLDLGEFDLDQPHKWSELGNDFQVFMPEDSCFTSKLFRRRLPALAAGTHYFSWLREAPNVRLFLHANVTRINLRKSGTSVSHLDLATLDGKRFQARAPLFVLACGGLENPRILLASNNVHANGIGNQHGVVGRFFMDHLRIESDVLETSQQTSLSAYDEYGAARFGRSAAIYLRPEVQEKEGLCAFRMKFIERSPGQYSTGYQGLKGLVADPLKGRFANVGRDTARLVIDPGGALHTLWNAARGKVHKTCVNVIEQTPNPASRVTLSKERDALGMRRIQLDWQLSEVERRTLRRAKRLLRTDFRKLGIGELRPELDAGDLWAGIGTAAGAHPSSRFEGGHHHSGTTRMGTDPRSSVVDADCRVHGVANLFLAGSSVFPTVGSANPTGTVCALAIRLADHMKVALN